MNLLRLIKKLFTPSRQEPIKCLKGEDKTFENEVNPTRLKDLTTGDLKKLQRAGRLPEGFNIYNPK